MSKITVYETTGFPNPARIRAALAEKNATDQVDFIEIDVMASQHRTPEFYAMNPMGTVPVLRTADGQFISESTAITEYIDHQFEGTPLTGRTAEERAEIHMMQRRAENLVLDAVASYFHHATPGLGPTLEINPCEQWGTIQKTNAQRGLEYFDQHLQSRDFVAASQFSMADITLFYGLGFADFAKLEIPDSLVSLRAWRDTMSKRPSLGG